MPQEAEAALFGEALVHSLEVPLGVLQKAVLCIEPFHGDTEEEAPHE